MSRSGILLIDDARSDLDGLLGILKPDYGVWIAKSGASGLRMAREHGPDLIIVSLALPDMSGLEVLAEVKNSEATRRAPVILVAPAADGMDCEEKGFHAGASDFLYRPFSPTVVRARIGLHLRMVAQERTLGRVGMVDGLTGLANRLWFDSQLAREWRRAMREGLPISLLLLDADNFRDFNTIHGRLQGDRVLQTLGDAIRAELKRSADFGARLGGEEFGMLLPGTGLDGAVGVAQEIREAIAARTMRCTHCGDEVGITVSVGVGSVVPGREDAVIGLMSLVEGKLYEAKMSGKNRVCS